MAEVFRLFDLTLKGVVRGPRNKSYTMTGLARSKEFSTVLSQYEVSDLKQDLATSHRKEAIRTQKITQKEFVKGTHV